MLAGTVVALDHGNRTARCTFSNRRGNPVVEHAETKDIFLFGEPTLALLKLALSFTA